MVSIFDSAGPTRHTTTWSIRTWRQLERLIHYDFCPSLNRWVLWITRPAICLSLISLACLLCAMFINSHAYLLLGATSAILALGLLWPWVSILGVRCDVIFDATRCREGEPTPVRITVTNRWPWPLFGLSLTRGLGRMLTAETGVSMIRIPGRSKVCLQWQFRPPHRGVFPTEEARLETSFPFGMTRASRRVKVLSRLIVWPATTSLATLPGFGMSETLDDLRLNTRVGDHGDLLGTRGFRQGDSLRRVHWAQTARQQRMIVCERQAPETLALRLELDADPEIHESRGPDCTWEQSLRVFASLAESLHRMHVAVECQLGGRLVLLGSAPSDVRRLLDLLAHLPTREQLSLDPTSFQRAMSGEYSARTPLTIRVTTTRRASLPPCGATHSPRRSSAGRRASRSHGRSIHSKRLRNELTLSISLDSHSLDSHALGSQSLDSRDEYHRDGTTGMGSHHRPPSSRRTLTATAENLTEELPRVWRSLCHVG